jgi:Uncharacterized protein conserved in bacteria
MAGAVLAQIDDTVVVGRSCASMRSRYWGILPGEGNHYFPPDSISWAYFRDSDHHAICPWKGTASYRDVVVGDAVNEDAAWYYAAPKEAAAQSKDRVAFWRGVQIQPD